MTQFAFFYFDPMYFVFVGPAFLFAMWAQMRVKSAFARWSEVPTNSRMTGAEVARRICEMGGAEDIPIEISDGYLSDHYDPINRVVRLSQSNYHGSSVAAAAIAAHEAGHAIQHATRYPFFGLRSAYVPIASLGSWLAFPLLFAGAFFSIGPLITAGIALFGAVVLFQLITLPVEFDASARAKRLLADSGLIQDHEEYFGMK